MTSCIVGLQMGILLFVLFFVFVPFSFSPDFLSKISPQPFKIETSNLVYWLTTTGNNVGLKMDILLFVPCIFLSLFIFRQRYQPYALEALKRGYSGGIVRFSDSSSFYLFVLVREADGIFMSARLIFIDKHKHCLRNKSASCAFSISKIINHDLIYRICIVMISLQILTSFFRYL